MGGLERASLAQCHTLQVSGSGDKPHSAPKPGWDCCGPRNTVLGTCHGSGITCYLYTCNPVKRAAFPRIQLCQLVKIPHWPMELGECLQSGLQGTVARSQRSGPLCASSFSCYREAGREVGYLTARGMVRQKPAQRFPVQHCGYLVVAKERKGPVVRSSLFGVHSMSGNTWLVSLGISLYEAVEAWVCIHCSLMVSIPNLQQFTYYFIRTNRPMSASLAGKNPATVVPIHSVCWFP